MDTRPGATTVDGQFAGIDTRTHGTVTELTVAGRPGIPPTPARHPSTSPPPNPPPPATSPSSPAAPSRQRLQPQLLPDTTIPNAVTAKLGTDGTICLYTYANTQLIVDINGYMASAP